MPRTRMSTPLNCWPRSHQEAFEGARRRRALFDGSGKAAHWADETEYGVRKRWGMWLHFLQRTSRFDPRKSPAATISFDALKDYIAELLGRVAPVTAATYVRDMLEAVRVMEPSADASLLRAASQELERAAEPSVDHSDKLVPPSDFLEAALARLNRFAPTATIDPLHGLCYGDGLMMGIEVSKPVRRSTLAAMCSENLIPLPSGIYELRIMGSGNKTKTPIIAPLSQSLTKWLDQWFGDVRPFLLRKQGSSRMWITHRGNPMSNFQVYARYCKATEQELGIRISPHMMRKIVASGVAASLPEKVEWIPALLDHNNQRTHRDHYTIANQMLSGRRYNELLKARRARIGRPRLRGE